MEIFFFAFLDELGHLEAKKKNCWNDGKWWKIRLPPPPLEGNSIICFSFFFLHLPLVIVRNYWNIIILEEEGKWFPLDYSYSLKSDDFWNFPVFNVFCWLSLKWIYPFLGITENQWIFTWKFSSRDRKYQGW